jgi:hypothetical protein
MALAERSGQPFLQLLEWHPRDVFTMLDIYEKRAEALQEAAREARFAAATEQLRARMGKG